MAIPMLPETAPFSASQRAWLNGFLAGVFGLGIGTDGSSANGNARPFDTVNGHGNGNGNGNGAEIVNGVSAPPAIEEDFPWHDSALTLDERMALAEGRPQKRVMMAAMAQLDCGACGYLCETYSEAIAIGEEKDLTKCTPGGKETSKKLKELAAFYKANPEESATATSKTNGQTFSTSTAPALNGQSKPALSNSQGVALYDRKNPFLAPLLSCKPLNQPGSEKDVRFVAFSLAGSGLTYEVGDALGLMPENNPELVEAVLSAMGARGDELVNVAGGLQVHSFDALAKHYVITKVSDDLASLLAASASDPSEASTLQTLVNDDVEGIPNTWDVLDLLTQFPSARTSIAEMIAALSPLQPRLYSISSSMKAHPDEVHLTVGVVQYNHGSRLRKGVASNFLSETMRVRGKAGVFIHVSPGFRLPEDQDAPIIMVGPGTGIAPFRAFLEERATIGAKGKNWLFFGDQRCDYDFLYRDEMDNYRKSGVLTRLDTAFSRDQEQKIYVQTRMRENASEIWQYLQEGAYFYVCGDARRMALDVDHALHDIIAEKGEMSSEAAKDYVKALSKAKRYQRDVY